MSKVTFKEFLAEYKADAGSLALQRQVDQRQADAKARTQTRDEYRQTMKGKTPEKGNLIRGKTGYFVVDGISTKGVHVRQLGGDKKEYTLPHGQFKFASIQDEQYPRKTVFTAKQLG